VRVVCLNPCGQLGGAETSLLEILAGLHAAMPDWDLHLVLGEDGPLAAEARALGVHVINEPFPPALARLGDSRKHPLMAIGNLLRAAGAALKYRRRLARVLEVLRPDVIHTNGFKMHLLGAWARPRATPLVWHIHDYVSTRRLMSRLLRVSQRQCSVAIVNSRSVAKDMGKLFPKLPVVPIYNAIDTKRFSPAGNRLDLDGLAGLPPASSPILRVGLVGTFARWKGHQVFLRALAQLPGNSNIRGYIVGGPIYQTSDSQWSRQELEQEADRLGLRGRVGFTGFVRDVPGAMRSLDIIVHASTEPEPFGMVIIEGMACGKPVIASQAGGAAELFTDGVNALAHLPGEAAPLAKQVERLACDPQLRARIGGAARQTVEKTYHRERLANEIVAVFESVWQGGSRRLTPATILSSAGTKGRHCGTSDAIRSNHTERVT
jgi:glycosyltransferase involved in cell wall biosynthesis